MRISLTGRFGIALIIVGIAQLMSSIHWLAPHPLVALDMPISLSPGHIVTGNVNVDLDTLYYIDIETDRATMPSTGNCEPYSVLAAQWTLSSDGAVVKRGSGPWEDSGLTIAVFFSENERYAFDATVLPGADCLNAGNPRLKIQTHHPYPSDQYTILTWLSVWFVGAGIVLLVRHWSWEISAEKSTLRIFPEMVLRNVLPLQRHPPIRLIRDLPDFGLVLGSLLFILMFIYIVSRPLTPRGLPVNIRQRNAVAWHKSPWPETLSVYVDGKDRFYLNGQPIPANELRMKLSEELAKRMVWTVYFEADERSTFMSAIYSFDTIRGLGARVVWITPEIREELNKETASPRSRATSHAAIRD
jgi:biopolymer transport protein ExbD